MILIVRESMLAEKFGAYLFSLNRHEVIHTDNITKPTKELLDSLKGKDVFIVGGYYTDNLKDFEGVVNSITVFYNNSDKINEEVDHIIIKASENKGFCTYALRVIEPLYFSSLMGKICEHFDDYLYGFTTEESIFFQNGVYCLELDKKGGFDYLFSIEYEKIIKMGKEKMKESIEIAEKRVEEAVVKDINGHEVSVALGDSPIVLSCIKLAQKTGIGMLVRYKDNKTFVSCRVTKESGDNAGLLMSEVMNGGGSKAMGGGSIDGILSIDQLFEYFNE